MSEAARTLAAKVLAVASLAASFGVAFVVGCGVTTRVDDVEAGSRNAHSDSGVFETDDAGGSFGGTAKTCTDATRLVYVISKDGSLHSFSPGDTKFTTIGPLGCAVNAGSLPFSMSVDRGGKAWILYDSGQLATASLDNASCVVTPFATAQAGFKTFGMGFSTDSETATAESANETLFVVDYLGKGLGRIDRKALSLAVVAPFTGDLTGKTAELAGTGDGKLYGLFRVSPARLVSIDKATGKTISSETLAGVEAGTDFAFSYWGGDFYFFTADLTGGATKTSRVTRYRPSDKSISVMADQVGFVVVGAGVSTCAPTTPIR